MKKMQFKLSNNFGKKVNISLEPEGTTFELQDANSVIVEVDGNENPVIDLQINKENGELFFTIWPEDAQLYFSISQC
jgi:hypothetical protein